MNNTSDLKIYPKSKRAIEYHKNVFQNKFNNILHEIEKVQLSVLIWGSGPSNKKMYKKRVQILNELRKLGLDAFFSEEEEQINNKYDLSQKSIEFIQAKSADLIIILRCSYGSTAELHDFSDYKQIAQKMYIFIDEATRNSYSSLGALKDLNGLFRKVESFKYPEDLTSCKLLGKVVNFIKKIQYTKYRAETNYQSWE